MNFPLFRKYPNDMSFFKIEDADHFVELKRTGKKVEVHTFEAKILPDRNFIRDMIDQKDGHWVESSEAEFEEVLLEGARNE